MRKAPPIRWKRDRDFSSARMSRPFTRPTRRIPGPICGSVLTAAGRRSIWPAWGLEENQLTYRSSKGNQLYRIVRDMLKHNTYTTANQFMLESLLYAFSAPYQRIWMWCPFPADRTAVSTCVRLWNLSRPITPNPIRVTDIADYVCINRSYLYTLFSQRTAYVAAGIPVQLPAHKGFRTFDRHGPFRGERGFLLRDTAIPWYFPRLLKQKPDRPPPATAADPEGKQMSYILTVCFNIRACYLDFLCLYYFCRLTDDVRHPAFAAGKGGQNMSIVYYESTGTFHLITTKSAIL